MPVRLQVLNEPVPLLEEAISAILSSVDMAVVLQRTGQLLRRHFGATRIVINRVLPDSPRLGEVLLVEDPRSSLPGPGQRFALDGTAAGRAVAERSPAIVDPIDPDNPRSAEERFLTQIGYGSLASFPLLFEGQILGTLDIAHPRERSPMGCCLSSARQVARLIGIALHNSLMVSEVKRLNELLGRENQLLKEQIREAHRDERYIAESPRMRELTARVSAVAPSDATVLIRGETGTGKEGLARMVHDFSPRFAGPFVVVNVAAIPDSLIESELFGHEKGAFTGAVERRQGRFEQAGGGTLFLDEIGDAPASVQVRLLRVLQERVVQRVGAGEPIPVNVRVVAATNRPLERMVDEGTFRQDLYYRLNAFPLVLPPLRERSEDIEPLARYFVGRLAARMHRKPPALTPAAVARLQARAWPGNVRELENYLERSLILSPGAVLELADAPELAAPSAPVHSGGVPTFEEGSRELIRRALLAAGGRIYGPGGAAALLGLKPTTLQGKMRKYRIEK